jgi:hypothetical protein
VRLGDAGRPAVGEAVPDEVEGEELTKILLP